MPVLSPLTTALLTSLLTQQVSAAACGVGFFGHACTFLCRCRTSISCDSSGRCPSNDTCRMGFFGPGCQYEDVVVDKSLPTNPKYLVDHNDSSCNNIWDAGNVVLALSVWVPFSWFRIRLNNSNNTLLDFSVTLNDNAPCQNERIYAVDPITVDVTCDTPPLLKRLTIKGRITPYVCSIYITQGRNIGVSRNATEIKNADLSRPAPTTVDGYVNTCMTVLNTGHTFWRHTFIQPHYLLKVAVYNAQNRSLQPRLNGFQFHTYDRSGSITYTFHDSTETAVYKYEFPIPDRGVVSSVEIVLPGTSSMGDIMLSLCEVELIGEVLCPEGTYGLECEQQCTCNDTDICNTVTGICAPGCEDITFGHNCKQRCNRSCHQDMCFYRTGKCIQCRDGYKGDYCLQKCPNGTYGKSCAMNCSEHCNDVCQHETGGCSCQKPYVGMRCAECLPGLYGPNCSLTCPGKCAHDRCHVVTGQCEECPGSRQGDYCEACPDGYYGRMCYKKCSKYCLNKTCDVTSGNCSACVNDYGGERCLDKLTGVNWFWSLVTILSLFGLFLLVAVFLIFMLQKGCTKGGRTASDSDSGSTHSERRTSTETSVESTGQVDKPDRTSTVIDDDIGTQADFVDDTGDTSVVSTKVDRGDDATVADDLESVWTEANNERTDVN